MGQIEARRSRCRGSDQACVRRQLRPTIDDRCILEGGWFRAQREIKQSLEETAMSDDNAPLLNGIGILLAEDGDYPLTTLSFMPSWMKGTSPR